KEIQAVRTAQPTAGVHGAIAVARRTGRPVGIISNNSQRAIALYLLDRGIHDSIDVVVGRRHAEPDRMKPNPDPVNRAVAAFGVAPAMCVFVGDAVDDMAAGQAAGVRCVGYANKPSKLESLPAAGANAIF